MRIQVASDLHLEFLGRFPKWHGIVPNPAADFLVLAGDIHRVEEVVSIFGRWPVPVLYVLGNHEFYLRKVDSVRRVAQQMTQGTSIVLLDNAEVNTVELSRFKSWFKTRGQRLEGLRILGGTLWTDYSLSDAADGRDWQALRMGEAGKRLSDHRLIQHRDGVLFRPQHALEEHQATVAWLTGALSELSGGRTLVITHHGPDLGSVHPRYRGDLLNGAFVSELPALLSRAHVWVHGHVHDSFDYTSCGCRVVANPRGYPANYKSAGEPNDLIFENGGFNASLLVSV